MFNPVPKPGKKKKNSKKVKRLKYCEFCGIPENRANLEVHCIYSKGGSGPGYTTENSVTLCAGPPHDCHGKAQEYKISREDLIGIVAERLGRSVGEVTEVLSNQRR